MNSGPSGNPNDSEWLVPSWKGQSPFLADCQVKVNRKSAIGRLAFASCLLENIRLRLGIFHRS
jgi:hypothetical protein